MNEDHGVTQMEQRRQQIWPDVVAGGALVTRHDDNKYSTDFIIDHILKVGNRDGPAPLQIQNELAAQNGNRMLGNTSAGKQLESDLGEEITKMKKKLNDMRRERDATKEEIKAFEAKLCRVESQRMSLRNYAVRVSPCKHDCLI